VEGVPSRLPGSESSRGAAEVVLRVEELHGGYGKKEILRGISLEVRSGEIVALIGPNGAGKSTLLKAVAGLLRLSNGRIFLKGRDITALPPHRRTREGIAYVMQGGAIFPSLTAGDHLALGSLAADSRRRDHEPPAAELLPEDLAARREPAGFFSGGQRQTLALATVLAGQPSLLLCDEPSAGLSPAAANELLQRIAALGRGRGLPVLWVEQRVSDILPLADRALLLRDGRTVAETDDPKEWLSADVLADMAFGGART